MKLLHSQHSFYTYILVKPNENYEKCVKSIISKMKRKGYKYDPNEFGDWRKTEQDGYMNGDIGSPLYFIKK